MYGKNKVIRKKVIFLSGSAKFSFAYPQYSHLHICNFAITKLVFMLFLKLGIRYLISWVLGI